MADLNALIAQGYQTPAPPDPFAQYAKMQQLNAGQTQNALAQYQLAQAQRADQEANALRQSLPAEFDLNNPSHVNAVLRASPVGGAALIEKLAKVKTDILAGKKTQGEIDAQPGARAETEARTGKLAAETLDKNLENFNKINSPLAAASAGAQGVTDYVTALYDHPILGSVASKMKPLDAALRENLAAFQADPKQWIAAHSQLNGQGILDTMKGTRQNTNLGGTSRGETIDVYGRVVPDSKVDTKMGISADASARLAFDQQKFAWEKANPGHTLIQDESGNYFAANTKTNTVTPLMVASAAPVPAGAGRGAIGVTDNARGMVPFVGKSAGGTEGERKAATLLQRLQFSQSQLTQALVDDPNAAKPGIFTSALAKLSTPLANTLTPEARQRVESAQLDMLDAALTLGTGAAYTKEQLEGYRSSYFPLVGDGPTQIKDKKARLENVISAAKIAAGKAGKLVPAAPIVSPLAVSDDRAAADKILGVQ